MAENVLRSINEVKSHQMMAGAYPNSTLFVGGVRHNMLFEFTAFNGVYTTLLVA